MAADDLATQGAKASAAMLLTWLSQNNLISVPQELIKTHWGLNNMNDILKCNLFC